MTKAFSSRILVLMILVLAPALSEAGTIVAGAECSAQVVPIGVSGPSTCNSGGAQASTSAIYSAIGNTLTYSISETGELNGPSAFQTWASVPLGWEIIGPVRPVVVVTTFSAESYDVISSPGTLGSFNYFVYIEAISTKLTGGAAQIVSDVVQPAATSTSEGLSASYGDTGGTSFNGLTGSITAGEVSGAFGFTETTQVFESDGITPAAIVITSLSPEPSSLLLVVPALLALYFCRKRFSLGKVK